MTPNTISNIVFIGLALAGTVLQHWFPIPAELLTFLWSLAGFNGVKTAATSQLAHDAKTLGLTTPATTSLPTSTSTSIIPQSSTKAGMPL